MGVKNIVIGQNASRVKVQWAKELRREMTAAEAVLWNQLRKNQVNGRHFRRQQVIDGFIVDFYCHACSLIVEVGGDIHDLQKGDDTQRQSHLIERGFHILRCSNDVVLHHTDLVVNKIAMVCLSHRHPLPETGRGTGG